MSKEVKFNISLLVNGKEQVVQATSSVRELGKQMREVRKHSRTMRDSMLSFAGISTAVASMSYGLQQVTGLLKTYTQAYATQIQAETQLATAMRNTMAATDDDVAAIKSLTAAQQQLGVVGDEVQMAGVKELALHTTRRANLEALIPLMNDLAVKQDGLNVSSSTTTSVAQMLGKALEGNTGALRRAGIVLDEQQEKVLKNGDEYQRTAVLVEALTAKVGGMNAELAQTDAGKAKQAANDFGDFQERLGAMVAPYSQVIELSAQFGMMLAGVVPVVTMLGKGVVTASVAVYRLATSEKVLAAATVVARGVVGLFRGMVASLTTAMNSGRIASAALSLALKGLLVSSGVGIAIVALTEAISYFSRKADEAKQKSEALAQGEREMIRVAAETRVSMDKEISTLGGLIKAHVDTKDAVDRLNREYGTVFGNHKTAAEWYDTLISKSQAYCEQLGYEAQIKILSTQKAGKEIELINTYGKRKQLWESGGAQTRPRAVGRGWSLQSDEWVDTPALRELKKESAGLISDINELNKQIKIATQERDKRLRAIGKPQVPLGGTGPGTGTGGKKGGSTVKTVKHEAKETEEAVKQVELSWDDLQNFIAEGLDIGDLKSLDMAKRKLSQINAEIDLATDTQTRQSLGQQRADIEKVIEGYETEGKVRVATGVDEVRTLEDIDAAVQQLREDEQRASADNVLGIERQITALDRKRSVLERGSRIAEMESEVAELRKLTEKDFTVEVRDIGFDRLTKKIKELQRMLSDTENPLTGDQADAVHGLIGEYEQMRSKSVDVFATMRAGVESVMGVGDSFKSLTDTLRGDGDAWDKVTAVIRTGLGLWDAVNGIIQIATQLSAAFAPVKVAEGAAQGTAAGATVAATSTTVAAQAVQIASNQAATSSFAELAAAEYHAAHAMIPFVGAALASGFTATMMGEIAAAKLLALESGGLAYGPTSALIGEYAGARSNPEVVAPLNKLRDIIEPSMGGEVEFKIDGRVLRGVLKKTENLSARS